MKEALNQSPGHSHRVSLVPCAPALVPAAPPEPAPSEPAPSEPAPAPVAPPPEPMKPRFNWPANKLHPVYYNLCQIAVSEEAPKLPKGKSGIVEKWDIVGRKTWTSLGLDQGDYPKTL